MTKGRALAVAVMVVASASGCAVEVSGEGVPAVDLSVSLPFKPSVAGRVNDRNDGSPFEPCVAYSSGELVALGILLSSVEDAAFSDAPNFRGCGWMSTDRTREFGQIVGNEKSLEDYKRKHSYRNWQTDRTINGRTVAVATMSRDGCFAVFMSKNAMVASSVRTTSARAPSAGLTEECEKAVAFATLATTKAP